MSNDLKCAGASIEAAARAVFHLKVRPGEILENQDRLRMFLKRRAIFQTDKMKVYLVFLVASCQTI